MSFHRTVEIVERKEARTLTIGPWDLEIARYEVPETKFSGGTASQYPVTGYKPGSDSYKEVVRWFGEKIAEEAWDYIQNLDTDPEYIKKRKAADTIINFFESKKSRPMKEGENFTNPSQIEIHYTGADKRLLTPLEIICKQNPTTYKYEIFSKSNGKKLADLNGFYFYFSKLTANISFIGSEVDLLILKRDSSGDFSVFNPIMEIYESMKDLDSSLNHFRYINERLQFSFSFNRIRSPLPPYFLEWEPNSREWTVIKKAEGILFQ